jgi:hypothetical protein
MKLGKTFESGRFLKKGRPFFFFCAFLVLFSALSLAREDSVEGRINRAAFPLERFSADYAAVPKSIESEVRAKFGPVLGPIRVASLAWFQKSFGLAPSVGDRQRILESIADTEIWKCRGATCKGCPADSPLGCVRSRTSTAGIGVVAVIHPCLVGDGSCPRNVRADAGTWLENIVTGVAFYKSGATVDLRKAQKASSQWIASTSSSVNRLLGACPGPYATDSMRFLLSVDTVSEPNPALQKCGSKYLDAIRDLPKKCPKIRALMGEEWDAFAKKSLPSSIDVLRCDSRCRKLLCRSSAAKTIFTAFGSRPTLLLADGACEGESPQDLTGSQRGAIPQSIRARVLAYGCLSGSVPANETSLEGLSDGPGVNLVE